MTDKPKNDNRSLLRRKALILSIGLNVVLIVMLLVLYVPSLFPPPPPIPELFYQLTATQLVASATGHARTQMAGTPSPEPIPTLSAEDEANLRNQYLNELETELGFLHPVLEDAIDSYVNSIRYELDATGVLSTNTPDSIIEDMDRTTFENVEYAAVVVPLVKMLSANSHQIDCRQKQVEYGSK